jgi:DNA polymerase IV
MHATILHIDMDAFFASVEQQVHPALKGKPVAVCGANTRTVVLTASYEARARGVSTGMTLPEARVRCPELRIVRSDHDRYTHACRRLLAICRDYTPDVEIFSVDEAFLDLTRSLFLLGPPASIARAIKHRIRRELCLTASIGIAPNKLLAKLASGLKKPDGLVVIEPNDIPALLEETPVEDLCGIGPALGKKLAALGITSCGQLGRTPLPLLVKRFGVLGYRMKAMGLGQDASPVVPLEAEPEAKSIGHSMTLERNVIHRDQLSTCLFQLSCRVGRRLRENGLSGRVVTLTLRYADFRTFSHQTRFKQPIDDDLEIYRFARRILKGIRLGQAVRLVGVSLSDLVCGAGQIPLFEKDRQRQRLMAAMDRVNRRYGSGALFWGTLLKRDPHRDLVSPAWRPEGIKQYC